MSTKGNKLPKEFDFGLSESIKTINNITYNTEILETKELFNGIVLQVLSGYNWDIKIEVFDKNEIIWEIYPSNYSDGSFSTREHLYKKIAYKYRWQWLW